MEPAFDLGQGEHHDGGVDRGDEHPGHHHGEAEAAVDRPRRVQGDGGGGPGWCGAHCHEDTVATPAGGSPAISAPQTLTLAMCSGG